jgi:hypothetical protein
MMRCQEIMASVKSASLATATDHSLYLKCIKVTTCTLLVRVYLLLMFPLVLDSIHRGGTPRNYRNGGNVFYDLHLGKDIKTSIL